MTGGTSIPCLARATIFEITVTDQLAGMSVWDLLTKTRSASWKGKTLKFLLIQMKSTECDEECSVKPTLEEERKSTIQCFVPHTNLELSTEGGRWKEVRVLLQTRGCLTCSSCSENTKDWPWSSLLYCSALSCRGRHRSRSLGGLFCKTPPLEWQVWSHRLAVPRVCDC